MFATFKKSIIGIGPEITTKQLIAGEHPYILNFFDA